MRGWQCVAVVALGAAVGGCAATTPTSKVAVDYNRIFAKARNEVLVTNILRAAEREPLQFSTMGSVTGGVRNNGFMDLTIPSLIGRGATILSPEFNVTEGINPAVSIVPLSNKEFTEGILKPVTTDEIDYFINQGWDQELVLELVVGGIVCPDGRVVFSHGDPSPGAGYDRFATMFASADRFPIQEVEKPDPKIIRMAASEAVDVMKNGVGSGRKVEKIDPVMDKGHSTGLVDVTIDSTPTDQMTGLRTASVCSAPAATGKPRPQVPSESLLGIAPVNGQPQGKIILRSVESIIFFLGETQWWRWSKGLDCVNREADTGWPYYARVRDVDGVPRMQHLTVLKVNKTCGRNAVPARTFVQTHFNDEDFYLLRQADAGESDRSLSTLSLLSELIALQTSESTISAGAPLITVGTK